MLHSLLVIEAQDDCGLSCAPIALEQASFTENRAETRCCDQVDGYGFCARNFVVFSGVRHHRWL